MCIRDRAYVESDFDEEIGDLSDEDFDNGEALDDQDIICLLYTSRCV